MFYSLSKSALKLDVDGHVESSERSEFLNKDMKEEFPSWFGDRSVNVSQRCEVCRASRDERRTTQNSGRNVFTGQLEQILRVFIIVVVKTANGEAFKNEQYISQHKSNNASTLKIMARLPRLRWKVYEHVSHKKILNGRPCEEDDPDVIHVDNSSDLALSTSLI
ncbi:hypothetical protein Tco_1032697 [Tanacetum coccineum]|uniref:Uncharacterized protein n=1 Tax=Tanacetum coccineum TaxID=301880 RepID=A0ABQ5GCQ6_9ASTR